MKRFILISFGIFCVIVGNITSASTVPPLTNRPFVGVGVSFVQSTLGKQSSTIVTEQIPNNFAVHLARTNQSFPILILPSLEGGYLWRLNTHWQLETGASISQAKARINGSGSEGTNYHYKLSATTTNLIAGLRYWQTTFAWLAQISLGMDTLKADSYSANGGIGFAKKTQNNVTYGFAFGVLTPIVKQFQLETLVGYTDLGTVAMPNTGTGASGSSSVGKLANHFAGINFGFRALYQF
jgi:hypothetical protein